jgi:LemA protein
MLTTIAWVTAGLLILGLLLYVIGVYNSVIALDRSAAQLFSNLESVMKQRHDELPKLVAVCRAHMGYESALLDTLMELRGGFARARSTDDKVGIENRLHQELQQMRATWERYPALKAGAQFRQINARITELETILNDRREQFNQAVAHYNIFIGEFPALLLAHLFTWRARALLGVGAAERGDPRLAAEL